MTAFTHETLSRDERYRGAIFTVRTDRVTMSGGGTASRDVVAAKGAVGVVAIDDVDRVVLIKQYRHAVGGYLWELPAGLRDADGEPPLETAKRELAEEAGLSAERWSLLVTSYSTPGFCDEQVLIYLAEGLSDAERPEGFTAEHEETDMTVARVPLDEAVGRVFTGGIRNASAVIGLLAAARARETSPSLRPVDAD